MTPALDHAMKILLAVDGSPPSDVAVQTVKSRPWPADSVVRVLSAVNQVVPLLPVPPMWGGGTAAPALPASAPLPAEGLTYRELAKDVRSASEALVQRIAEELSGTMHLTVETAVREGDPREVIVEEAKTWKADLIVLGSRGSSGIQRWLLGSVAESTVRHAPCSVEVARSPET
jgi:nucleotide-binding universal stress UspA family protein